MCSASPLHVVSGFLAATEPRVSHASPRPVDILEGDWESNLVVTPPVEYRGPEEGKRDVAVEYVDGPAPDYVFGVGGQDKLPQRQRSDQITFNHTLQFCLLSRGKVGCAIPFRP